MLGSFNVPMGNLYAFFGKMSTQVLCPFKFFFFLMLSYMHSLYIFNINILSAVSEDVNILSLSVGGLFVC